MRPQEWHLQDSLEYQWTLNRSVLDYAARNRERLLYNIYQMGKNGIDRGAKDSWTIMPKDIDAVEAAAKDRPAPEVKGFYRGAHVVDPALYDEILHAPDKRDPRGYVLPPSQRDMPTTIVFPQHA